MTGMMPKHVPSTFKSSLLWMGLRLPMAALALSWGLGIACRVGLVGSASPVRSGLPGCWMGSRAGDHGLLHERNVVV